MKKQSEETLNKFTHLKTKLWQVLSQGYAQSIAFTSIRSKYQSPTDSAIPCIKNNISKSKTRFINNIFSFSHTKTYTEKKGNASGIS